MKKGLAAVLTVIGMLFCCGGAQADLTDGLVAYYPLNGNANDESGNGYHGSNNGAVEISDGVVGSAMSLMV